MVTYDDGVADGGDAVDNGHEDIANGAEDALDTADYGTHCEVCVCSGSVVVVEIVECGSVAKLFVWYLYDV
jgi:hypothetical protein